MLRPGKKHVDPIRRLEKADGSTVMDVRTAAHQAGQNDGCFFTLEIVDSSNTYGPREILFRSPQYVQTFVRTAGFPPSPAHSAPVRIVLEVLLEAS